MDYGPQTAVVAAITGVAISYSRYRFKFPGWSHVAIVLGVPFLASIVMAILGLMAERDDAQVAFGLAAVLFYSFFAVPAYILSASIAEFVLRKVRSSGQANHPLERDGSHGGSSR